MGTYASHPRGSYICAVHVSTRTVPSTLRIRDLFEQHRDAVTPEACAAAAQQVVQALRAQLPCQWLLEGGPIFDFELATIVDALESISPIAFPSEPAHQALDDLNEQIARLLDWADDMGISLTASHEHKAGW